MAFAIAASCVTLTGPCPIEEAPDLHRELIAVDAPTFDLAGATYVHTAVAQVILASRGRLARPPADAALGVYADRPDWIALTFAVTYWDRLGWKDTFAKPEFTERQYAYAKALGAEGVYTPQVIVNGRVAGVGAVAWYITLVTNTDVFKEAPTSWEALWDPANADKLGLLALVSNSFLLEVTAKTFFGGTNALDTEEGILKAFDKLAEVKPNVRLWYRDEAQFEQSLKSGEIPMGQYYHDVTGLAAADGQPVRSTFPKEGGIQDSGCWALSRASTKTDEAHIFIDYMCQPAIQATLSRKVGTAPTVKRELLDLTDAEFASVSSDIEPITPRYDLYQTKSDWLNQKWTELIVG